MQTRKSGLGIGSLLVVCAVVGFAAQAEDYPTRSVKLITQGAAASGPDVVARIVAEHLGRLWGQQITVLNHPGAGGSVAARQAASATADGYTLYMPATSAFIVMPQMFPNLPFDLDRDFVPIGFVAEQPMVIAVAPSLGVNVLQDLIMLAKKQPGEILYAANARGTLPPHGRTFPKPIRHRAYVRSVRRCRSRAAGLGGRTHLDDRGEPGTAVGRHSGGLAQSDRGCLGAAAAEPSGFADSG